MSAVVTVTDQTFATEVLNSSRPVLVDYWADWCSPCKQIAPIIAELAAQYTQVKFCQVDTNANPSLAARQGVLSLPTLQVIVGGDVVQATQGGKTKSAIIDMLSPYV